MTVTYRSVLVTQGENGEILTEQELPASLLSHSGTHYLSLGGETQSVTAKNGYGYRFLGWSDGEQSLTRRDRTVSNVTYTAYYTYDTGKLSFLSYADGTLRVIEETMTEYSLQGVLTKVADKKEYSTYKHTYTLTFTEQKELLGMQGKKWLLAPVYEDPSMLRDYFGYSFASFTHYAPKGKLVILMNEYEYAGVYLLSPNFLPEGQWTMEYGMQDDLSLETLDMAEFGIEDISCVGLPDHKIKINKQQVAYLKGNVGAVALIGVPCIKDVFLGRAEELLSDWLGDESYMFQSPSVWKEIIGTSDRIDCVEVWEMECFDAAWEEWFATEHKYALGDKQFYDTLIKPYTCFVGIYIKLK